MRTSYKVDNYTFNRSKVVNITIAVAKHGFVDLLTFLCVILWIIALHLVMDRIQFKEKLKND